MKCKLTAFRFFATFLLSMFISAGLGGAGLCKESKGSGKEITRTQSIAHYHKADYVDLIVSKVIMRRGVYSGQRKVQIIPCIQNLEREQHRRASRYRLRD